MEVVGRVEVAVDKKHAVEVGIVLGIHKSREDLSRTVPQLAEKTGSDAYMDR